MILIYHFHNSISMFFQSLSCDFLPPSRLTCLHTLSLCRSDFSLSSITLNLKKLICNISNLPSFSATRIVTLVSDIGDNSMPIPYKTIIAFFLTFLLTFLLSIPHFTSYFPQYLTMSFMSTFFNIPFSFVPNIRVPLMTILISLRWKLWISVVQRIISVFEVTSPVPFHIAIRVLMLSLILTIRDTDGNGLMRDRDMMRLRMIMRRWRGMNRNMYPIRNKLRSKEQQDDCSKHIVLI